VAAWVKQSDLGPLEVIFFCGTFSDDKKIASENTTDWGALKMEFDTSFELHVQLW